MTAPYAQGRLLGHLGHIWTDTEPMVRVPGRQCPTFQAACLLPGPSGHRCVLTLRSLEACPPRFVPSEKTTAAVTAVPSQPGHWLLWRTFPHRSILFIYFAMTVTGLSFLIVFTERCCHQIFPWFCISWSPDWRHLPSGQTFMFVPIFLRHGLNTSHA